MNERGRDFLEIKDLTVEYTSEGQVVHAVNGVSLKLDKGQTLGLVGETGAGKTTIAKSIMRILPPHSSAVKGGEIYFEGRNLQELSELEMHEIRGKKISMIFQDPMTALNPVMRVGEQIAEGVALHEKVSKKEAQERAEQMLEMVGIPKNRYKEYPHQFSGGMKQRVVIAMTLACNPRLLLADEPTTALDVTIQAQVLEMMRNLVKKKDASMILITHDLGVVAEMCDYVAVVYAGEIVEHGDLFSVFDHPSHPYTKGLFGAIPKLNEDKGRLHSIEGLPPDPTNLPLGCYFCPRCPRADESCVSKKPEPVVVGRSHYCRCGKLKKWEANK